MDNYKFSSHYANDADRRDSLNALAQKIWGITVLHGGETDYTPFSYFLEKNNVSQVVANICVGQFTCIINGERTSASMIQTVMTDKVHRSKGLIRALFEPVQEHVLKSTGRSFLTASRNKRAFYEKFGFQAHPLIDPFNSMVEVDKSDKTSEVVKVDLQDEAQNKSFEEMAEKRAPVSERFGFVEKNWLLFWFCKYVHANNIYYSVKLDAYLIYTIDEAVLALKDIVSEKIPTLQQCLEEIDTRGVNQVIIQFTPDLMDGTFEAAEDSEDYFYADKNFSIPVGGICLPDTQLG